MTRLLQVEMLRLWWRRLPLVGALGLLTVLVIALVGVNQSVGERARALAGQDQAFNQAVAEWEANGEQMVQQCREDQELERERSGDESLDFACDLLGPPTVQNWFGTPPSVYEQVVQLVTALSLVLLFVVVVIGCSSTTKELAQRSLGTWLTFEPRRGRVFVSKLLAAALWTLPLTVLLLAGIVAGGFAVLTYHGVPDGVTGAEWVEIGWLSLRVLLLAVLVGGAGAGAGFLVRNVAILIGLAVGYAIAVESILVNLVPSLQSWTVSKHVSSWIQNGYSWTNVGRCDEFGCSTVEQSLTFAQSAGYLGLGAVLLTALGFLVLWRKDLD